VESILRQGRVATGVWNAWRHPRVGGSTSAGVHFKSKSISIVREGELAVEGDLTIHRVTRKVRFAVEGPTPPIKDPSSNTRVAISATTKINRKDFGLTWNAALETGGILVGDDVTITLDVEFVKA
jgi:polyisoprenoid-binding protein YceI